MKTEFITINQAIAMLDAAKREHGGSARVEIHNRHGDRIKPKRMEQSYIVRGQQKLEPLCFTDEP